MAATIVEVDPQGADALALLGQAAVEARALYPDLFTPDAPWPGNGPTPPGGIYLLAYEGATPVASGALRPRHDGVVELRRLFVTATARRHGIATLVLRALEEAAGRIGYTTIRLETGYRQLPAIGLYVRYGFRRIEPFDEYVADPTSVCFEKRVMARAGPSLSRTAT